MVYHICCSLKLLLAVRQAFCESFYLFYYNIMLYFYREKGSRIEIDMVR